MHPSPDPGARPPYRVVQWATGAVGSRMLRAAAEHPLLDVVGVYVTSAGKAGRDAGELCGLPRMGVAATRDIEEILALRADCVLHAPRHLDAGDLCRLLATGTDVVTTRTDFHHPPSMDPALRERVEAACAEGSATLYGTGASPGFVSEALPLVLASVQRRLDGLLIEEFADLSRRDSPELLFEVMGFGRPAGAGLDERRLRTLRASFGPSLRHTAEALGIALDAIEVEGEVACARERTEIASGSVAPGTIAAQRITVSGSDGGRPRLRFRATWYVTRALDQDWRLRETGWRLALEGDAPLDVTVRFPVAPEQAPAVFPAYTANRAVNAVPYVRAAPPGIRTTSELPQTALELGATTTGRPAPGRPHHAAARTSSRPSSPGPP